MHNGGGGLVAKSCPTLETLWTVCSLPGFSVHRILQARILQWVAISFSRMHNGKNKKKRRKETEEIFETTLTENFPLMSDTKPQTQEVQNGKQDK